MPSKYRLVCLSLLVLALSPRLIAAAIDDGANGGSTNDDDNSNDPQSDGNGRTDQPDQQRSRNSNSSPTLLDPTLNEKSVVLITGAAGFIGSELALALRRTYNVKKLLLVDNLGIESENESYYVPTPSPGGASTPIYETITEHSMSMFEIKRQRTFRIFHELTAAANSYSEGGVEQRNNAAESIRFYRADMRPSIPEFFDFGEVPLLEGIFQSHPDITHVVHLADVPVHDQNQAIPRNKDSVKTGRMEGLLEEFRLMIERASSEDGNEGVQMPQFVYASSHEVYDWISTAEDKNSKQKVKQTNPPPFREDKPITTPSSLHGTAKLIDEVLASAYHSTHGIYSVGLRFFPVYGPWDAPVTEVFDLVERVTALNDNVISEEEMDPIYDQDVKDYVYIDDAVDAIMSAMQYRPPGIDPPPVVFNVGTGEGSTLKEVKENISKHYPNLNGQKAGTAGDNAKFANRLATASYASPSRSESLLGFKAQVPLAEGLAHTLTWHRDRALPYGRDPKAQESSEDQSTDRKIADSLAKGRREECSPLDRECLRGAPVFPCASECHRAERCTPSAWDDVATLSKLVTAGCDAVLYTILLDENAEQIPSATATTSLDSLPYVGAGLPEDVGKRTQARCNIAFVSDGSPLVRRLRSEGEEYLDEENGSSGDGGGLPPLLRHGFWTVLPVSTPNDSNAWVHAFDGTFALEYLPKQSPGRFFGTSVRYAIYSKPTVLLDNLPNLLKRMESGPPSNDGSTALMVAEKRSPTCDPAQRGATCAWNRPPPNDSLQTHAYNMIRIALRGDIMGGGLNSVLDSSLVVHSLKEEDTRLFRCDVYGEAAQWGASSDERAIEFIVSLHDLWSRAVVHWSGQKPWWIDGGEDVSEIDVAAVDIEDDNDDSKEGDASVEEGSRRRVTENNGGSKELQRGRWMGLLSAAEVPIFAHILPSEGMGIIHLDDN